MSAYVELTSEQLIYINLELQEKIYLLYNRAPNGGLIIVSDGGVGECMDPEGNGVNPGEGAGGAWPT